MVYHLCLDWREIEQVSCCEKGKRWSWRKRITAWLVRVGWVFEDEMIPVYKLRPVSVGVEIDIDIIKEGGNGEPSTVDSVSSVYKVIDQPFDYLLPGGNTLMFGDFITSSQGRQRMFDIPEDEDIVGSAVAAEGMVTYNFVPTGTPFTQSEWESARGLSYNHNSGYMTANLYEIAVDRSNPSNPVVCDSERQTTSGSWCSRLDEFDINAAYVDGSFSETHISFTPKVGQGSGQSSVATQIELPLLVQLSMQYTSACPVVRADVLTVPTGAIMEVSNPSTTAIEFYTRIVYGVEEKDAQGNPVIAAKSQPTTVTELAAGGTTSVFIPNNKRVFSSADIFRRKRSNETVKAGLETITTETAVWVLCDEVSPIDLTTDREVVYNNVGTADTLYVHKQTFINQEDTLSMLLETTQNLSLMSAQLIAKMLAKDVSMGFHTPSYEIDGFDELISGFITIALNMSGAASTSLNNSALFSEELQKQAEEFNEKTQTLEQLIADERARFNALIFDVRDHQSELQLNMGNLTSINAVIRNLTSLLVKNQKLISNLTLSVFDNIQESFGLTADALSTIARDSGGIGLFGAFGAVISSINGGLPIPLDELDDAGKAAYNGMKSAAEGMKNLVDDALDKLNPFGFLDGFGGVLIMILIVGFVAAIVFFLYDRSEKQKRFDELQKMMMMMNAGGRGRGGPGAASDISTSSGLGGLSELYATRLSKTQSTLHGRGRNRDRNRDRGHEYTAVGTLTDEDLDIDFDTNMDADVPLAPRYS